jgi:hypothetical protein
VAVAFWAVQDEVLEFCYCRRAAVLLRVFNVLGFGDLVGFGSGLLDQVLVLVRELVARFNVLRGWLVASGALLTGGLLRLAVGLGVVPWR